MTTSNLPIPPKWFWIFCSICFVWNAMGIMAFIAQITMSPKALAELPEAQRIAYETVPLWAILAFAAAVFGGTLGCLALLLRKTIAFPLLAVSLVGIILQMYHAFFLANSLEVFGPGSAVMPTMIILLAIFLLWFTLFAKRKGWLM